MITYFSNPTITTNGYTITIGNNYAFVGYDNATGDLMMYVYNNLQQLLSTRPISTNTNMIFGIIPNETLVLNSTSNTWEWTTE